MIGKESHKSPSICPARHRLPAGRQAVRGSACGVTLTELLVATIIVGILMLGVVAVELAMRRAFSTTSASSALAMRVSGALLHISKNAGQAVGYGGDVGINRVIESGAAKCTKLYVRQDTDGVPGPTAGDLWVRYSHDHTSTNASFKFCPNSPRPQNDAGCADSCPSSATYEITKIRGLAYNLVTNSTIPEYYLEVILNSYYDNSAPTDPILNPKIENMRTKVHFISHTW